MTIDITDEMLVGYADNELSPEERVAFESALDNDPKVQERLALLQSSDQALRRFSALSDRLPIQPLGVDEYAPRRAEHAISWPLALAASIVAAAIGLGVGLGLNSSDSGVETFATNNQRQQMNRVLFAALENSPQGASVSWPNSDNAPKGTATIKKTWQLADGTWCREYEYVNNAVASERVHETGAACRNDNGDWQVRLRIYSAGGAVFRKSGEPEAI